MDRERNTGLSNNWNFWNRVGSPAEHRLPVIGENTALNVITAVLLGGANLSGGVGSALGSFGGLLCISLPGNGLNLFDVPAYYQRITHRPAPVSMRGLRYRSPTSRQQPSGSAAGET